MALIPTIRPRSQAHAVHAAALQSGYSPLQARILAGRLANNWAADLDRHMAPRLADLDSPWLLPDIEPAAEALADAVMDPDCPILIVCDHDADGSTSLAVLWTALTEYFGVPAARVGRFLSHRMREGYGVSDALVDRLLEACPRPSLIITADQGSTDEARFKRLREAGHRIIVTDHHEVPESGPPASALACVNPVRADSRFPDRCIAGCHVAWLVACATRQRLIDRGHLTATAPNLGGLLDYVALGTTADAVSFARSRNNRIIVSHGLRLMNQAPRPCWVGLRSALELEEPFNAEHLGWTIGPMVNARGRLSDAMAGADFLCAPDAEAAHAFTLLLKQENEKRKAIEKGMMVRAREEGWRQYLEDAPALVIHLPDGHAGVHGIVASRMVEAFGRPTVCFSPKQGAGGHLTGSFRSVEGVNVRDALVAVSQEQAGCPVSFGGHAMAAGALIEAGDLDRFREAFCAAILRQRADLSDATPVLTVDGTLDGAPMAQAMQEIEALGPYGREFDPPLFHDRFQVLEVRRIGDGTHLSLTLRMPAGGAQRAVWFRAVEEGQRDPVSSGDEIEAVYGLSRNYWKGRMKIDMQVRHATSL